MGTTAQEVRQSPPIVQRRLPIGAEIVPGGVHFRVWAPLRRAVEVVLGPDGDKQLPLTAEPGGYFSGVAPGAGAGTLYRFRLDGETNLYPDPASRFQPEGPHGPSQVVDPDAFAWTDPQWPGAGPEGQVLYEMHVGTFTKEGTWAAAARELPELKDLGVTCLEVMPVGDFPGRWGWGYDGVNLFAPTRLYGTPDDFRRFVDRAHALGLAVILDVVYNHVGPDGNYLGQFSADYFSTKHKGEWGDPMNFDGKNAAAVREFYLANARCWVEEFHVDGYRFDATQAIVDDSPTHILREISQAARAAAGPRKRIYLVNENEPQETHIVRPAEKGGFGMDALWNDDFHHSAMVVLSARNEAYYTDHRGRPQEFVSSAKWGYLFQGQYYTWQKKRRGTPAFDLPPTAFVNFIENHDQVANFARGQRTHQMASPAQHRAMVGLLLLMPQTPMLFQGQEFAASSPFQFFIDHNPELTRLVCKGRGEFMEQFPSVATPEMRACLPNPADPTTFERCKLDLGERAQPGHAETYRMYKDLLRLRREERAFRGRWPGGLDGAVLGNHAFALRYFEPGGDDRLLVVNFDADLHLEVAPEPLLAPPAGTRWELAWSSEYPRYGGTGALPLESPGESWRVPGRSTSVLRPVRWTGNQPEPLRAPPPPNEAGA
jgi:maltooligosyltrehalose trehalohydrolase